MRLSAQTEGKRSRQRNMDAKVLVIPRRNEEDGVFFATNPRELRKICNLPSFLWSDPSLLRQILNVLKEPITHVERRRKREGRESGLFSDHSRKKGFPFLSSLFVLLSVFLEGPCEKDGWGKKLHFRSKQKGEEEKGVLKLSSRESWLKGKLGRRRDLKSGRLANFHISLAACILGGKNSINFCGSKKEKNPCFLTGSSSPNIFCPYLRSRD